jgi:hypothetical protein
MPALPWDLAPFCPLKAKCYRWEKIEAWRVDYNLRRPYGSLGHLTPDEYAVSTPTLKTRVV